MSRPPYPRTLHLAERDSGAELFPRPLFLAEITEAAGEEGPAREYDPDPKPPAEAPQELEAAPAAGSLADLFGEPISVYTRRQAIEDGILVALEDHAAAAGREAAGHVAKHLAGTDAGRIFFDAFHDIAFTVPAFELAVWPILEAEDDTTSPAALEAAWLTARGQDMQGRLWDVLWLTACKTRVDGALRAFEDGFRFQVNCLCARPQDPKPWSGGPARRGRRNIWLKVTLGLNDSGAACLTFTLPEED